MNILNHFSDSELKIIVSSAVAINLTIIIGTGFFLYKALRK